MNEIRLDTGELDTGASPDKDGSGVNISFVAEFMFTIVVKKLFIKFKIVCYIFFMHTLI